MSHSFTFNEVNMSDYGLVVTGHRLSFTQETGAVQLHDKAYAFESHRPSQLLSLDIAVTAASATALKAALDNIRKGLNLRIDGELSLDLYTDRYWLTRFKRITGNYRAPLAWAGLIDFLCHDPMAYDNDEVGEDNDYNCDGGAIIETPGGTGIISPVYTLTANEGRGAEDIKLKNVTTGEELVINTAVTDEDELVINVPTWYVTRQGDSIMSGVSGQFPRLKPDAANSFTVTGFGALGILNITYRNRYV